MQERRWRATIFGPIFKHKTLVTLCQANGRIFFFFFFTAALAAYGSFQTRGQIGAAAAGLRHSHCNTKSQQHLCSLLQLVATLDS